MNIPTIEIISEMIDKLKILKVKEMGFENFILPVDEPGSREESEAKQLIRTVAGCDADLSTEDHLSLLSGRNPITEKIPTLSINALRRLLRVVSKVFKEDMIQEIQNDQSIFTKEGERLYKIRNSISLELQSKKRNKIDTLLHVYWDYLKEEGSWGKDKQAYIKGAIESELPSELDNVIHELEKIKYKMEVEAKQPTPKKPAETEQTAPAKPERESWLWKLYGKTLKVIVDVVMERLWPK